MKRVGFYLDHEATEEHRRMAVAAASAVRRHMPDAHIVHLATVGTPPILGSDAMVAVAADGHAWHRRAAVQALAPLPMLSIDVDVLMRRDVSELWELDCDLAIPDIADPHVRNTGGVWFCRSRDFLAGWGQRAKTLDPTDIRGLLSELSRYVETWPGKLAWLDEQVYERVPKSAGDACDGAALVHYRGPRKRWFPL